MNNRYFEFKKRLSDNILTKVDTLGSYDFWTSIITLDALTKNDLSTINPFESIDTHSTITQNQYSSLSKILPLAGHEYTHFIDSTSTLWGMRHLKLMNNAYATGPTGLRPQDEQNFFRAKAFYDHIKKLRLPMYYSTINTSTRHTHPWKYQISIGKTFSHTGKISDNPVLFTKFQSTDNDEVLSRSPFSMVALLETSAMAQEFYLKNKLIEKTETDFRQIEQREFKRQATKYLYNQEITEYSVCAHLIANYQKNNNFIDVFLMASLLTRIILNLPQVAYKKFMRPGKISKTLGLAGHDKNGSEFINRLLQGVQDKNLGIIYFLLCIALPENTCNTPENRLSGATQAIKYFGLNLEELQEKASLEINNTASQLTNSPITSIAILAEAGLSNFKNTHITSETLDFHNLSLPPAWLGDGETAKIFNSPNSRINNLDLDSLFEELGAGERWTKNFSEACL